MLIAPHIAQRSCDDCRKWVYDEETGERIEEDGPDGPIFYPRPPPYLTPCHKCPKTQGQPVRTRRHAVEIDEQLLAIYLHYRESRAVLSFPDDALVRRHARIIREVEDGVDRDMAREDLVSSLLLMRG